MEAKVLKILPAKRSINGNVYIRITFLLEDGNWAKTDICPDYLNYKRWLPIIKAGVGTKIKALKLKRLGEINADSFPEIIKQ